MAASPVLFGVLGGGRYRAVYASLLIALAAACAALWDPADLRLAEVVVLLLATAFVDDTLARRFDDGWGTRWTCGSLQPVVLAALLLGPVPAALIGGGTALVDSLLLRARPQHVFGNVFNFVAVPLLAGLAADTWAHPLEGVAFLVAAVALAIAADFANVCVNAVHSHAMGEERVGRTLALYRVTGPVAVFSALVVGGAAYGYSEGGFGVLVMLTAGLLLGQALLLKLDRVEHALRAERDLHESYLRTVGTIVVSLDPDLRVTFANRRAVEALGLDGRPEALGSDWVDLTASPLSPAAVERRRYARLLAGDHEDEQPFDTVVRAARGRARVLSWNATLLHDERGRAASLLLSGEDVTEQREADRQMSLMAYSDALTGLPNRPSFDREVPAVLAQADACGSAAALLFLDLDGLKRVNDRHGVQAGDRILAQAAGRLLSVTSPDDLLVRRCGDEFLLLVPDLRVGASDAAGARRATARIAHRIARAFEAPFVLADTTTQISVAVGAAVYPIDARDSRELERVADQAMYAIKQRLLDAV